MSESVHMAPDYGRHHRRKAIRLRGYDYSQPGFYFVTICAYQREMLFGDVVNGKMVCNSIGEVIQREIKEMSCHYGHVSVNSWCIMPNHVHLLLHIGQSVGAPLVAPPQKAETPENQDSTSSAPSYPTLGNIVRGFKSAVSRNSGIRVWQRGYHDHIVRNPNEFVTIREYIQSNPANWEQDRHNPLHPKFREWRDVPADLLR